jgi:hypothetical protein
MAIRNPLQLILELLKTQIFLFEEWFKKYEQGEIVKQVFNKVDFENLEIHLTLCQGQQDDNVSTLFIRDNGPGYNFSDLKEAMTGVLPHY